MLRDTATLHSTNYVFIIILIIVIIIIIIIITIGDGQITKSNREFKSKLFVLKDLNQSVKSLQILNLDDDDHAGITRCRPKGT